MRSGRREERRTVEHERRGKRAGVRPLKGSRREREDSAGTIRFPSVCRYTIKTNARSQELAVSSEAAEEEKLDRETQMTIFLLGSSTIVKRGDFV